MFVYVLVLRCVGVWGIVIHIWRCIPTALLIQLVAASAATVQCCVCSYVDFQVDAHPQ